MINLVIWFMRLLLGVVAWTMILMGVFMLAMGAGAFALIPGFRKKHRRQLKSIEKYLGYVDLDGEGE